jgi:hypothetical protein
VRGLQRPAVLHRFRYMRDLHGCSTRQVGNGSGHFQAAVNPAARPTQPGCGGVEKFRRRRIELALRINGLTFQSLVGAALPGYGALAGQGDAASDGCACLTGRRVHQLVGRQRTDFHMQVNPVEQGPAEQRQARRLEPR